MGSPSRHWVADVTQALRESLVPVPHETNEIDWKVRLSDKKDRLTEHLIAFANHSNGGYIPDRPPCGVMTGVSSRCSISFSRNARQRLLLSCDLDNKLKKRVNLKRIKRIRAALLSDYRADPDMLV